MNNVQGKTMGKSPNRSEQGAISREDTLVRGMVRALLKTSGFRSLVKALVDEALTLWSGKRPFKRAVSFFIRRSVNKSFAEKGAVPFAKQINEKYEGSSGYLAGTLKPEVSRFTREADFGEVQGAVEKAAGDLPALARAFGDELRNYPAKMVCLYAMAPPLANSMAAVSSEILAPLNELSPDLLVDVINSLVRELDPKETARLVNGLAELVRKIHTGSGLMGTSGSPALTGNLADLAGKALDEIDLPLLLQSRLLLEDLKEQLNDRLRDRAGGRPDLVRDMMKRRFRMAGNGVRSWSRDWDLMEDLFTDDEFGDIAAEGMGEIDPQELAEIVNRIFATVNRVRGQNPDLFKNMVRQVTDTLDPGELEETARWAAEDLAWSLKPAAESVMPHLVRGITELMRPGGENFGEMREALDSLRDLILGKEADND